MSTWLITGTSRGLGIEFVRQLVARGDKIFATARNPASSATLQSLAKSAPEQIHVVQLDTAESQSIKTAAEEVQAILSKEDIGLDYLLNNAAISVNDVPTAIEADRFMDSMRCNVLGPALVFQEFLPMLERSKRPGGPVVVNVTSELGSLSQGFGTISTTYSVTKAALNMLTIKQANEKPNVITMAVSPGWTKTDLGGPNAPLEAPDTVRQQIEFITKATKKDSGTYRSRNGGIVPW